MKAAPADIFVWGVNPDITIDDIVEDLADSDIIVKPEDILKKTRVNEDQQQQGRRQLDCYKMRCHLMCGQLL